MDTDTSSKRIRFVERTVAQPRAADLAERVDRLEEEVQALLRQLRILTLDYEAGKLCREDTAWHYDVAEPNFYFNNVYHVELLDSGTRKRWVDQTGRIAHVVYLPRQVTYEFFIGINDFMDPSYSQALCLRVDGQQLDWKYTEGNNYIAVIPPLLRAFKIDFEVFIDREKLLKDATVSFSFSKVSITSV